jgi:hypothetical protein
MLEAVVAQFRLNKHMDKGTKGSNMKTDSDNKNNAVDLRCPECRAQLKERRSRTPDKCEMICGGCGQSFDVCDLETLDELKKQS